MKTIEDIVREASEFLTLQNREGLEALKKDVFALNLDERGQYTYIYMLNSMLISIKGQ